MELGEDFFGEDSCFHRNDENHLCFLLFAFCFFVTTSPPDSQRITDVFDHEETDNNSENSHLSKPFYETDTHPPENKAHEKTGDITVPDS